MTLKIIHKNPICSFNANWIRPIMDPYLQFEPWDTEKTYAPGTVFYTNCMDSQQTQIENQELLDQGFRIIIDNLWECDPGPVLGMHRVNCNAWFWYNESLWYKWLGYDNYTPHRDFKYRGLMPMNRRKPHRDDFLQRIDTEQLLWSYCEQGRQLPNDKDMSVWDTQRYMDPAWYDSTYMSMVVESLVRPGSKYTPIFITEKTFKPIAFQHPFVVYGNRGTLQKLREWGFETWNHLWDESYDQIVDTVARRDAVIYLLNQIEISEHSAETLQKLQHNKNHFFDENRVRRGIIKEIIEPILHYAETDL